MHGLTDLTDSSLSFLTLTLNRNSQNKTRSQKQGHDERKRETGDWGEGICPVFQALIKNDRQDFAIKEKKQAQGPPHWRNTGIRRGLVQNLLYPIWYFPSLATRMSFLFYFSSPGSVPPEWYSRQKLENGRGPPPGPEGITGCLFYVFFYLLSALFPHTMQAADRGG